MTDTSTASSTPAAATPDDALADAQQLTSRLGDRLRAAVLGRDDVVELLLVALIADGHVLLEDYPGSGKTTLARALGEGIRVETNAATDESGRHHIAPFRRIQFTPDLLPSDITGTNVFDLEANTFHFRRGPIFAHVVLADEINRTSPKVQAAMLEAMAEKQVTVDDDSHGLDELFFVIATQNPLDLAGTYPLPTPQLDRFLFKIVMKHIARDAELEVLSRYPTTSLERAAELPGVTRNELVSARRAVRQGVVVAPMVKEALVDLARGLRDDPRVLQGASTRSLVLALPALQARAVIHGRDHVTPDDIQALSVPIFAHRIELAPGQDDAGTVIAQALAPQLEKLARASLRG